MTARVRVRFWIQAVLASATGLVLAVTIVWPDWMEAAFGFDADRGDGSVEWLVVMLLAALTVALAGGARGEWRRARRAGRARRVTRTA